jgi:hypothetical protein
MTNALDTGSLVDHIGDAIAFADGLSGAFRYACAAGDAVFANFHCHDGYSLEIYYDDYKINPCCALRQMTNISCLVNFVTVINMHKNTISNQPK